MAFSLCQQFLLRGRFLTPAFVKSTVPVSHSTPHTTTTSIARRVQHQLHTCTVDNQNENVVYLRNLPWKITTKDVSDFLNGCAITNQNEGIHLVRRKDGRLTGECYVELETAHDVDEARGRHRELMKNRRIQVFEADPEEFEHFLSNKIMEPERTLFVRVQGLTGVLNKEEVIKFFRNKVDIGPYQITLTFNEHGRPTGEVFIEFASELDQRKALEMNDEVTLGEHYQNVVISECWKHDKEARNSKTGHMVMMRGLPYEATEGDVHSFLQPLEPVEVRLMLNLKYMPNGMCEVDFMSHDDAVAAMDKNMMRIGRRYIELFLESKPVVDGEAVENG